MNHVLLLRLNSDDQGTLGALYVNGKRFCWTLELPWRDNARKISCIPPSIPKGVPPGMYTCAIRKSPRFGMVYWLTDVQGRTYVLIHSGNLAGDRAKGYESNVEGCILLGERSGKLRGQKAVLVSKPAVRRFMKLMGNKTFKLEIQSC